METEKSPTGGCLPELWLNPDLYEQIYQSKNDIAVSPALIFSPASTFYLS